MPLTLGSSIDSGLNLVPREGPPTKMTALVEGALPTLGLLASEGSWRLIFAVCTAFVKKRWCGGVIRREEDTWDVFWRTAGDP